jgi:MHS family proline/betaine transporter-like MFS transporter
VRVTKKTFITAAIGNIIENYDYALLVFFFPIVAPLFFHADSVYHSLARGYFYLFLAMLARPFGGWFFGYIGDVYGRKTALLISMYGIALATGFFSLMPSYETAGVWAIVCFSFGKSLQMFCFGGEYNGAGIFIVEHAQNNKEALAGSILTATTLIGSLFSTLAGVLVTLPGLPAWSWRFAFIFGCLLGILGIKYRNNLAESPHFKNADAKHQTLSQMIKTYPKELLAGVFAGAYATITFTSVLTFINPVLMSRGYFTSHQLMLFQSLLVALAIITLIPSAMVADRTTPARVMKASCWGLILFTYPILLIVEKGSLTTTLPALALLIIVGEIFMGPSNAFLKNLFIMQYRYRASSISFCIGTLSGGLTPMVENYLYQQTGRFSAIAVWIIFIAVGSLVTVKWTEKSSAKVNYPGEVVLQESS